MLLRDGRTATETSPPSDESGETDDFLSMDPVVLFSGCKKYSGGHLGDLVWGLV